MEDYGLSVKVWATVSETVSVWLNLFVVGVCDRMYRMNLSECYVPSCKGIQICVCECACVRMYVREIFRLLIAADTCRV